MKKVFAFLMVTMSFTAFAQSDSQWKVVYVWQGYQMENVKAKNYVVKMSIAEKTIEGTVGCNSFHGTIDYLKGDKLKPTKVSNKQENCPPKPNPSEKAIVDALKGATRLVTNQDKAKFYQGDKLVLELDR